tara:strand:- start:546 stop:800 length:255 start_codon:yes stop_codon:yes gene_type:complete
MLKKELINRIEELEYQIHSMVNGQDTLETNNNTLQLYVNQLRGKLQEVSNHISIYEKTIAVMASRLEEMGQLIKEQNIQNNRSE